MIRMTQALTGKDEIVTFFMYGNKFSKKNVHKSKATNKFTSFSLLRVNIVHFNFHFTERND
jgi:hypothetical protein